MPGKNLKLADGFASDYDSSILHNNWNGPEVIFNASKNLLKPKSKILDIGIGTGESSLRFQNVGHCITGFDGSKKMLLQCKKKNIASEYILHNIEVTPYPINNKYFNAVVSSAVFHLVYPLKPVFPEIKRILKPKGIFVFTYENTHNISDYIEIKSGIWKKETDSGVLTFKYSDHYISELLEENNFEAISKSRFLAFTNKEIQKNTYFIAVVARQK